MHKRIYNKLYVNTNREEGSEKIFLGYQTDSTEYTLNKDKETYFNIPPYTQPVALRDASFIIDGATAGSFPAISDRIFESRKNYGKVSNNGTPSEVAEGIWFCSWLYKNPITGSVSWYDRYFDPKVINYNPEIFNGIDYLLNAPPSFDTIPNSVIYDVPTTMVLEPSVLYRYFHIGEKYAQQLLTTFEGVSGEHLLLDITNWSSGYTNLSSYPIEINSKASASNLFPTVDGTQVIAFSALNFNNNQDVEAYINWNPDYIPSQDFTLGIWCESNDWSTCPSTQLVGNYSAQGGFGIFVDTHKTYPYFIIPEVYYGHVLLLNQQSQGFLDKAVVTQLTATSLGIPTLVAVNFNNNIVVCSSATDVFPTTLYKLDSAGNLLAKTNIPSNDVLIDLLCDEENNIFLTTNTGISSFDNTLSLIKATVFSTPLTASGSSAFSYNTVALSSTVVTVPDAIDLKFIGENAWSVLPDGIIYKNGVPYLSADGGITNIQIDPNSYIWALHGNNNVSVFDPYGDPFQLPTLSFTVGTDFDTHAQKYISFINIYDRAALTMKWVSIIYYSDTNYVYVNDLNGKVVDIVDITPFINYSVARELKQNSDNFTYGARGDFTGYDFKRVFNSLYPNKQLTIKAALKDKLQAKPTYRRFQASVSIEDWNNNTWKHIILTHKNKTFTLYINGAYQTSFSYSGRYELAFDQQPPLFFGTPLGVSQGLNIETGSTSSIFNGTIGDVKLYDYSINPELLDTFMRAGIAAEDMTWNLPIPSIGFIEKIERMFKNKLPGSKSNFYNIKLVGTNITDLTIRALIEEKINTIVQEISPAHTDLIKIVWIS